MFQTQPSFASPFQFEANEQLWRVVELLIEKPIYIIKLLDEPEHVSRTFMYTNGFDADFLAEQFGFRKILEMHLLAREKGTNHWKSLRIKKIGHPVASDDLPKGVIIEDFNGHCWSVDPLKLLEQPPRFKTLLDLA